MSLVVWLPLNGDLHNQGLSDLTVTNNGATVNNNGKIGECYQFNTSGSDISLESSVMTSFTTECSVSFWLNILTWNASYATYFQAGLASTPWTSYIFGFLRNGANSTCCFTISNGSSASNANYLTPAFDLNKWYHIGLVYKTGHCLIYIDGNLYKDYTTTIVPNFAGIKAIRLGRSANGSSYQTNCLMNDFRIYNHAFSAVEVKELAQGLVLHYKLDDLNNNLLYDTPKSYNASAYNAYQFNLKENLVANQTYTMQLWDVDIEHSEKTETQTGLSVYWGGGSIRLKDLIGTNYFTNGHADYLCFTFTPTSANASHANAVNVWLNIYNSVPNADGTRYMYIGYWKLEKGDKATSWRPEVEDIKIHDSSGYGHDGTIVGELAVTANTPRYNSATSFNGTDTAIKINDTNWMVQGQEVLTINFWAKSSSWAGVKPLSCTEGGGFNIEGGSSGYLRFSHHVYTNAEKTSTAYKYDSQEIKISELSTTDWNMITCVYTLTGTKTYINGQLHHTYNNTSYGLHYNTNAKLFLGCESAGANPTSPYFNGQESDFRIYATALSDDDIRQLYATSMKIDKGNNIHPFEIEEFDENKLLKTGVLKTMASELEGLSYLKYDNNLYIEPDGSCWVRVFHHNNPAGGAFASGDPFATSVYKDANRWFNFELANHINKWEIMVKQKATASDDEVKYRWVQTVNPMSATFAQVAAANITKVTTSGYTNFSTGGLYKIDNTNTYLCTNNGTNGNWWGAMGTYVIYQGGTPAWSGKLVTTGYIDTFLRIDNLENSHSLKVKSTKNNLWLANQFIER